MDSRQTYHFPFASYPAIRLLLLLACGIIIDYHTHLSTLIWALAFGIIATIYIVSEWHHQSSLRTSSFRIAICCYLGLVVAFGGFWHSLFDYRDSPTHAKIINSYTWQDLTFYGTIEQLKQTSTGKFQIDVEIDTTSFPNNLVWNKSYKLRAILNPDDLPLPEDVKLGNNIAFNATIYPLEAPSNPSQFNYKDYLASIGIYSQAGINEIDHIGPQTGVFPRWTNIRQQALDAINTNFSNQTTSLAKALLIGYKNELQRENKVAFSRAGLSHIMAVSGLHVGFILAPFWVIIPFFWTFRYGKQLGLVFLIGFLFFYAGLTGFPASVTRASLVGGFLAYGKLFYKVRNSKNLTAVAALIILIINPSDLFSIGFQLSFSAVYIILLLAPVFTKPLPIWIQYRWYGQPLMIVMISFIVQLGLFPLLAYYFGEFSIVGPFTNALVIPFLGIAIPLALLILPIGMASPGIANFLNFPIEYFLRALEQFVTMAAHWPGSWIQVHIDSLLLFGIWTISIFFLATLTIPKIRWKILILFLLLLCIGQGKSVIQKLSPEELQITIFDVGQGDATLVSTPNDKHFLIDTGRWQLTYNSAKYILLPHLKAENITKLNGVFLSHPHADHIGGIPELINQIPIDTIYNSGTPYNSGLYQKYHQKASEQNIPIVPLSAGDIVMIDPSMRIFIYGPDTQTANSNVNNRSLLMELIYGNTEFLFLGDAEQKQEAQLVKDYPMLADTDVLKVAHHGSKTSSTPLLLQHITAQTGVVSLALKNRFRHPHKTVISRLHKYINDLHFTSLDGGIIFSSDGKTITKRTLK
ncbi:DNA internalization-related competence protein ComEC/Rec2 [Fodinibius saliphilus]|uniref:DNA internalization-related competence protein ComEC/Rec2 n=1 Tax=Fodinibius saliphilus TaxID=1920650 RepID=UPI001486CBFC|nr:DNA internalization-related competence protein ComEC/Rec2 [Fodinibius saliphilus]